MAGLSGLQGQALQGWQVQGGGAYGAATDVNAVRGIVLTAGRISSVAGSSATYGVRSSSFYAGRSAYIIGGQFVTGERGSVRFASRCSTVSGSVSLSAIRRSLLAFGRPASFGIPVSITGERGTTSIKSKCAEVFSGLVVYGARSASITTGRPVSIAIGESVVGRRGISLSSGRQAYVTVVATPITPITPGYEYTTRNRTARAIAQVNPPVTPAPSGLTLTPIYQSSETYPVPVIINGIPYADSDKNPWLPSKVMSLWAKQFRVKVNGFDVTFFRGLPTIPQNWASQEPGGDASCSVLFPGITIFDTLPMPFTYPSGEVVGIAKSYTGLGYWQATSDGLVLDYGDAAFFPSAIGLLNAPIVGIDSHPSAYGYATVGADGGVFAYGAVPYVGSIPGGDTSPYDGPAIPLPAPIAGIALSITGNGYLLVDEQGAVYAFGDAPYHGNADLVDGDVVVGICLSGETDGDGYQIITEAGRTYAFGDAIYRGNITSPAPITGIARWTNDLGYDGFIAVNALGEAYAMGPAEYEGGCTQVLDEPVNSVVVTPDGAGYWMSAGDGGIFAFGDAPFLGSVPSGGTPANGSLSWARLGSTIVISYIDEEDDEHVLFEGIMYDWEDNTGPGSIGMTIDCIGSVFQLDWYIAKPIVNLPFIGYAADTGLPIFGWDSGLAIATAINATIASPSIGTAAGVGPIPPAPSASPLKLNMCTAIETGITTVQQGAWDQLFSSYIQNILSQMQQSGIYQYTVANARYRGGPTFTPAIFLKDFETVNWTVAAGAHGVSDSLSYDASQAATAIFGTGQSPPIYTLQYDSDSTSVEKVGISGQWQNTKYPRIPPTPPAFPLDADAAFIPGGADTGFSPFSNWMRWCGYPLQSQNSYISEMGAGSSTVPTLDQFLVRQFQIMAGLVPSGYVDKDTWNAAFLGGQNEGAISSSWYEPLWELNAVEPHSFTPSGAYIGPNPRYNPQAIRVEQYENMGQQIPKSSGIASAFVEGERTQNASWTGTITLASDPQEGSRYAIKAGDNILLRFFHGQDTLFHVSAAEIDFSSQTAQLTVSSMPQDLMTIAAIIARDASTYGVARAARPNMVNLDISPTTTVFDSESSAGVIGPTAVPNQGWTVIRVPFSQSGSVAEISLTSSEVTTFCVAVFSGPVTAAQLNALLPTPSIDDISTGNSPWNDFATQLDALGLLYAAGGPDAMCGYYPNDQSDNDPTVTGVYIDASTWSYFSAPGFSPWLWVAFWGQEATSINGNFYVAPPGT